MTREALLAPFLFLAGLCALAAGSRAALFLAALLALLFLYCQARILNAAKGIPAWRQPLVVALLCATGLAEGAGLLALLQPLAWLPPALLALLALRLILWRVYRYRLAARGAPQMALAALDRIDAPFVRFGHWAPLLLLLAASLLPAAAPLLVPLAGLGAAAAGWLFKYALIVRAGYNQGYALAQTPVRGGAGPASGLASKPGWNRS